MVTGSNMDMLPAIGSGLGRPSGNLEDSLIELELILRARRNQQIDGRERDLNICRSGGVPPTVEGSLSAVGRLFANSDFGDIDGVSGVGGNSSSRNSGMLSEDEIRSRPAYLSYYYSLENISPRLPPPFLSKEDWRVAQRFQASGSSLWEHWRLEKEVG